MIYSKKIRKAMWLSFDAHKEDKDRGTYPYVYHPYHLAEQMDTEDEIIVALLHDVKEDHDEIRSWEQIEHSFGKEVTDALKLLTHRHGVSYKDYIIEIGKNPLARKVKMADLLHNMDTSRLKEKTHSKLGTYQWAYDYLSSLK